ncbi:MAG: folylpolyglutamate synthase/dihydrofolate synthase family protein [Armatimonadota bacterium]|nr:folylpolyglutamate synthase/dihydrofolate synthase family protein [Armatimonadota bacterium]
MGRRRPMTYRQAAEWLEALADPERTGLDRRFARRMNLDATRRLMELLGDPHERLAAVHIAGTKGKGSVAAMVEAAARAASHRTGMFTSPHLVSWRERVRINGQPITEEEVARLASAVRPAVEQVEEEGLRGPSFFEACTAMALLRFAEEDLDLCVVEVGLGGRLDATNVVAPLMSVITTLGIDHAHVLGDTLAGIAQQKAGIIKPGVPVVSAQQPSEARVIIQHAAAAQASPLRFAEPFEVGEVTPLRPRDAVPGDPPLLTEPLEGGYAGARVALRLPLAGEHQAINAGVAAAVCEGLSEAGLEVPPEAFVDGLEGVRWPARVQVVDVRPWVVIDCAHNQQSARALMRALRRHLVCRRLIVVLGLSEDKPAEVVAGELSSADHAILTRACLPRAMPAEELAERTGAIWRSHEVVADPVQALAHARETAEERDAICVTGSFFVLADLMEAGALPAPDQQRVGWRRPVNDERLGGSEDTAAPDGNG